jgi:hypothetical protein
MDLKLHILRLAHRWSISTPFNEMQRQLIANINLSTYDTCRFFYILSVFSCSCIFYYIVLDEAEQFEAKDLTFHCAMFETNNQDAIKVFKKKNCLYFGDGIRTTFIT